MAHRFRLDEALFLERYWQREPLLIRNALPGFVSPLSPEELAGLSMEPSVQSRIISVHNDSWRLEHGPFDDVDFQRDDQWTLLVQQVDQLLPSVEALKTCVGFLPTWRLDDVMVSYAVNGGSVGPHFDRYDVFLVQGIGRRRWFLGDFCDDSTPRLEHDDLNLLKSFTATQEYLLEPGDVLYVPPGLSHWGVAEGECMTYSLGFRAAKMADLLARMTDTVLERLTPELLLEDAHASEAGAPGEITPAHIQNARSALINAINALDDGSWLAEVVSEGSTIDDDMTLIDPLLPGAVRLLPGCVLTWIRRQEQLEVFVANESLLLDSDVEPLLADLCSARAVNQQSTVDSEQLLLNFLIERGLLVNEDV